MTRADERDWRRERARLNERRAELGQVADALYPHIPRVGPTSLLCRPEWVPPVPIPLESVALGWAENAAPPVVDGARARLPAGYRTYSEAMGALARPAVFKNLPSYRLLAADLAEQTGMRLASACYFDGVDTGEAVAHELVAEVDGLPLRTLIGDPCDLSRRSALPAVTTVTIRRRARDFVLHWRDPAKVVHAGGLHQVMPVGMFQPITDDPRADLDLWRCMAREFSEEFLGSAEEYGPGFSYERWPFFQQLNHARGSGGLRAYCLGLGVDPLTLATDLLTAVVIDDHVFDALFGDLVTENNEGSVTLAPFDGTVPRPMQPAGAAALELAWRHRGTLLNPDARPAPSTRPGRRPDSR